MDSNHTYIQQLIRKTFEKHNIEDISLQNALTEIFEQAFYENNTKNSSSDVLSEKLRDEPRDK